MLKIGQYSLYKKSGNSTVNAYDFEGTHDCSKCGLSTDQEVCDTCTGDLRFFCHFCGVENVSVEMDDVGEWWIKKPCCSAWKWKPAGIKN